MNGLSPDNVLKFMDQIMSLKHASRRGWDFSGVNNHEQVASHMYSMGMMTFLLGSDSKLDRLKCLQLALVHDLGEAITGDITPRDNIPEKVKHQMEDEALKKISSYLGEEIGPKLYELYKEYEAKETPEAKFVKDLDRFDLICTAEYYERRDNTPGKHQEYFDATEGKFDNSFIKELVEYLNKKRSTNSIEKS